MASENTRKWAIIPEPNSMTVGEGTVLLPYAGRVNESIAIGDGDFLLAHQLVADIRSATGTDWDIATGDMWSGFIRLRIADSRDFDSQDGGTAGAYTLTINTDGITITGCDFEGVRNGVQTLRQLIRQNGAVLPELQIADAPACQIRGYYLDATRGRVPTLAWLKQWADKLCLYKYNQLQLYIEHTFAFDGMSETWRGSSPLTPADTLEFDQYCANLGIELVPSVSTFGHQYVAMRTQELRELGEFPEDADRPFSFIERMRHHTLNVADDRAFAFSAQLVDSYLQLFRSKRFNICADETFDLGKITKADIARLRKKTAFVFQNYNLLPKTTAVENVELPLMYNSSYSAAERHKKAVESLVAVGLGDRLMHKSNQMSGGQMQRVAIARALVNDPAVILADEATGNLDTRTSFEILVLFQKLHAEGRTIIFVTHNPEIAQYSSRNITLRDGHVTSDTVNRNILNAAEALARLPKNDD